MVYICIVVGLAPTPDHELTIIIYSRGLQLIFNSTDKYICALKNSVFIQQHNAQYIMYRFRLWLMDIKKHRALRAYARRLRLYKELFKNHFS